MPEPPNALLAGCLSRLNLVSWGLGAYTIYLRNIGLYSVIFVVNTALAVVVAVAHISSSPEVHVELILGYLP